MILISIIQRIDSARIFTVLFGLYLPDELQGVFIENQQAPISPRAHEYLVGSSHDVFHQYIRRCRLHRHRNRRLLQMRQSIILPEQAFAGTYPEILVFIFQYSSAVIRGEIFLRVKTDLPGTWFKTYLIK